VRHRRLILGSLLSVLFLYLAFRKSDLGELWEILGTTRVALLVPAVVLTLLSFWLRSIRWRHLLAHVKPVPVGRLFRATMIGFMANNLLPARLGELYRAHVIGRWEGISRSAALATIAVERIFDLFTMLVLLVVVALVSPLTPVVRTVGILATVFGLLVLGLFLALFLGGERILGWAERVLPRPLRPRGVQILASFREGLGVLREGRQLLWAAVWSFAMWACIVLVIQFCFWATDVRAGGEPVPPLAAVVVLVVMALGLMVPSGPGFVGSLQFFAVKALEVFDVGREPALAFSLVYHATQWFPVTLVGLLFLIQANLSLKEVAEHAGEAPAGPEGENP
jgi:hypothetical protein